MKPREYKGAANGLIRCLPCVKLFIDLMRKIADATVAKDPTLIKFNGKASKIDAHT